jgi:4-amino-4-deoxy-L-arabinose transferase-like glycosyltransferase
MAANDARPAANRKDLCMRSSRLVALLALLLVFDLWYRGHTFGPSVRDAIGITLWPAAVGADEPLDCDEAAYAYIGHRILHGDVMYRDLTENKPPLGYWLYTLGVAIGGYHELAIRVLPIPFVLASIALAWWIALRLGRPAAAFLAGGLFVLLSTDPYLFGNGANLEHFINFFALASLSFFLKGWDRADRWTLVASGVCLGAATLVKQVAIAPAIVFVGALAYRAVTQEPGTLRKLVRLLLDAGSFVLGLAAIIVVASAILMARGAGGSAYDDIFRYGRALATDTLADPNAPSGLVHWLTGNADPKGQLPWPFGTTDYLVWWATGSWPLWLVSIPSLAYCLLKPAAATGRPLVACWTLAAWGEVALPGLYWPHYYLLPIAGTAIVVAVSASDAAAALVYAVRKRGGRGAIVAAAAVLLLSVGMGATAFLQIRDYLLVPPTELTIRYKGGRQWVVLREMGRELARRASAWHHPRLYVWGWQSPLHFYSQLDSPTRHFFVDNLLRDQADRDHPLILPRTEEISAAISRQPPEMIFTGYPPFRALRTILNESYLPSRLARGLWIRRDTFGKFESISPLAPAGSTTEGSTGQEALARFNHGLIAVSQSRHDLVPALGEGIISGGTGHRGPAVTVFDQAQQAGGQAGRRFRRLDQNSRPARLHGLADPAGTKRHHG